MINSFSQQRRKGADKRTCVDLFRGAELQLRHLGTKKIGLRRWRNLFRVFTKRFAASRAPQNRNFPSALRATSVAGLRTTIEYRAAASAPGWSVVRCAGRPPKSGLNTPRESLWRPVLHPSRAPAGEALAPTYPAVRNNSQQNDADRTPVRKARQPPNLRSHPLGNPSLLLSRPSFPTPLVPGTTVFFSC